MTDYTPDLHLPLVAPNQDQKETTINTALAILEASANDSVLISLASGNVTLNDDQYTKYFLHQFNGNSVVRTVTLPNTRRWFAVENLGSASITFKITGSTGLTLDLPSGKIGLAVSDGVDLRYVVPDPTGGLGLLTDLSDVTGVPTDGQLLRWFAAESSWKPWTLSMPFIALSDAPHSYNAAAGKLVGVNATGDGLEFVSSAANVNSFVDLDDTPSSYASAAGYTVKVNSVGTGLTFALPRFTEAADTPANYTGSAGFFVKVNGTSNGLIFAAPKVGDLADGPGAPSGPNALRYLRVNAAGDAVEYATGTGGPDDFLELADTPNTYVGAALKFVRVGVDEDQLIFSNPQFTDLSDVPHSYTGAGGKFLQVKSGTEDQLIFAAPKVGDLSDGPTAPTAPKAKQVVRVNVAGNALEYFALKITDLGGFPTTFTGQGGKYLVVKADETGVQFSTSSYTTSFLALNDVPLESYDGLAGRPFVVDPTATGLVPGPPIPTKLGQLADVEDGTGTPVEGYVLTWKDSVWQAEPPTGGSAGSSTLAGLTDVDYTTPPTDGQVLTFSASENKWQPDNGSTVAALDDLTDVDLSTPANGEVLTFRSGEWVNESPTNQGVPSNGAHLYWRLLLHTTDGSTTQFGIQEIEFKRTKTGSDLCVGGTASASTEESGQPASGAFDDVIAGAWFSTTAADGQWIEYEFTTPAEVRYLTIMGSQSRTDTSPASFSVQWSDDDSTWTTAWEVTGQTGWAPSQIREFHAPLDLFFTDLADVPQSYIGQALKALRVNAGSTALEFYTPSTPTTTLAALTDVNIPAPTDNQVLAYDDVTDKWIAKTLAIPDQVASFRGEWSGSGEMITLNSETGTIPTELTADASGFTVVSTQPDTTAGTLNAIKTRPTANSGLCYLEQTVNFVSDTPFKVRYKVSSESGFDFFRVLVDGVAVYSDSGTSGVYEEFSTTLTGIHTVRYQYSKDAGGIAGDDCTYISQITYKQVLANPFVYGDTVTYSGTTYFCLADGTSQEPGTGDEWIAFSAGSGGTPALADLTDVDLSSTPTEGQVLTWNEGLGKWIAATPTGGSSEPVSPHGAHPYWRILVNSVDGGTNAEIGDLNFQPAIGGGYLTIDTGYGDASSVNGGHSAADGLDQDVSTYWQAATATGEWLKYHIDPGNTVMSVMLTASTSSVNLLNMPADFDVQYSDDESAWTTAWNVTGATGWTSGEAREFIDPGVTYPTPVPSFLELSDTPDDYTGFAGMAVTVTPGEDGVEFTEIASDFGVFVAGKPLNSEKVVRFIVATPFVVQTGTHQGSADAASTASKVFSFTKNGTEFLTATFAAAGTTATFSANAETAFAAGDVLMITAPAVADATLADISFTLKGRR